MTKPNRPDNPSWQGEIRYNVETSTELENLNYFWNELKEARKKLLKAANSESTLSQENVASICNAITALRVKHSFISELIGSIATFNTSSRTRPSNESMERSFDSDPTRIIKFFEGKCVGYNAMSDKKRLELRQLREKIFDDAILSVIEAIDQIQQ